MRQVILKFPKSKYLLSICLIGLLPVLSSCSNEGMTPPRASEGVLDAGGYFSNQSVSLYLDGEWEFYPSRFVMPGEFHLVEPDTFLIVPGYWNQRSNGKYRDVHYATYRLRVVNHGLPSVASLRNNEIFSAFRLFVNGRELLNNGVVGTSREEEVPVFQPSVRSVFSAVDTLELVLHVSNFHHVNSGIFESPQLGTHYSLWNKQLFNVGFSFLVLGGLLIMALYHLGLFFVFMKDRSPLYFSLFLLLIAFRMLVVGEEALLFIFPSVSWETMFSIEYFTFYLSPVFFLLFFYTLFTEEVSLAVVKVGISISVVFSVLVLLTPGRVYMHTLTLYQVYAAIVGVICLYWLVKAMLNQRKGAVIFFIGGFVMFVALLHDFVYYQGMLRGVELFSMGLLAFTLCQSYVLSVRFSKINKKNHDLLKELDYQNKNLEQIVEQRTRELHEQKELLMEFNNELEQQKEDMMAQTEMVEGINDLLEKERKTSEKLILNVLPGHIAQELKVHGKALTHTYPMASVMFVDFVGFSTVAETLDPAELLDDLHFYFANFDDVANKYNLEKIKTIGDAYMCVGGLHENANGADVIATVNAALEISQFINDNKEEKLFTGGRSLDCRIGIHTGPVIAGVVGKSKFAFDIWGPTVNIAKRMESACEPGEVNLSETTWSYVKDAFHCVARGEISVKHKNNMKMFYTQKRKF